MLVLTTVFVILLTFLLFGSYYLFKYAYIKGYNHEDIKFMDSTFAKVYCIVLTLMTISAFTFFNIYQNSIFERYLANNRFNPKLYKYEIYNISGTEKYIFHYKYTDWYGQEHILISDKDLTKW